MAEKKPKDNPKSNDQRGADDTPTAESAEDAEKVAAQAVAQAVAKADKKPPKKKIKKKAKKKAKKAKKSTKKFAKKEDDPIDKTKLAIGKGRPGPGRPKGVPNKWNHEIREDVRATAKELGGLTKWAKKSKTNENLFWTKIYIRIMPKPIMVEGKIEGGERQTFVFLSQMPPLPAIEGAVGEGQGKLEVIDVKSTPILPEKSAGTKNASDPNGIIECKEGDEIDDDLL